MLSVINRNTFSGFVVIRYRNFTFLIINDMKYFFHVFIGLFIFLYD